MKIKLLSFLAFTAATTPGVAALIITEFMANPSALLDNVGEYFEVYNSGPASINVGDLTIADDGSNSIDLMMVTAIIPPGEFFVFGNSAQSYVDYDFSGDGTFVLANTADEIVITNTSTMAEISRLNYTDGDPFGAGISVSLNDISNAVGGVTQISDYISSDPGVSYSTGDAGTPGAAGVTVVPEPGSTLLISLAGLGLIFRRRRG